jgi:heat shock protein HslJ
MSAMTLAQSDRQDHHVERDTMTKHPRGHQRAVLAMSISCLLGVCASPVAGQTASNGTALAGTSWQLVRFQGGDDTVLTPDDGAKYTLAFGADGVVAARIDCNRGRGSWKSTGNSQLELGPLALTRAACPPGSMHDQIVKQWANIRSYVIREGHLFLSLMADGGIYEFQPAAGSKPSSGSPVQSKGPITWTCTPGGETLRATFYATTPAMVLLERGGVTRPAFQIRAASGSRYQGDEVSFWEARGEAALNWMGVESTCRPQ